MNSSRWVVRAIAALLGVTAGSSVGADNSPGPKPAYVATDTATGAVIRVYRTEGVVSLEVDHSTVQIRKQLKDGAATTRMSSGADELVVALTPDTISVRGAAGTVDASRARPDRAKAVKAAIAASRAAANAAALIGRMQLPVDSPIKQTLLSTRALVLASEDDDRGAREMSRAIAELDLARRSSRYIRAADEQDLVGQSVCWTLYTIEAIGAYIEYENCMADEQWWDIFGQFSCGIIYDFRAIGAFTWWLSCVGLKG